MGDVHGTVRAQGGTACVDFADRCFLTPHTSPNPLCAAEVVGRRVGVSKGSKGACTRWEEATLTGFDPATGLHMLKYSAGTEEEVALGPGTRFKWLDEVPEGTEPNPSYASGPKGQEAVGRRIKVYWSGERQGWAQVCWLTCLVCFTSSCLAVHKEQWFPYSFPYS